MIGGLTPGMLLCRSRWADYANAVFEGMASPVAAVMLMAAITGFGRTYEADDGSETRQPPP